MSFTQKSIVNPYDGSLQLITVGSVGSAVILDDTNGIMKLYLNKDIIYICKFIIFLHVII